MDGYVSERDYPYSPIFKCQPGGGCHECGGIGVLWQGGDYLRSFENYGDVLSPIAAEPARGDAVPDAITYNPVYDMTYVGEHPTQGYVYKRTLAPKSNAGQAA